MWGCLRSSGRKSFRRKKGFSFHGGGGGCSFCVVMAGIEGGLEGEVSWFLDLWDEFG